MSVVTELRGPALIVTIDRPAVRNAVDGPTAALLAEAFREFERRDEARVLVLTGAGGNFCAGADLKGIVEGRGNKVSREGDGPMGPTRMVPSKPTIAAVEGCAVAGGLELAIFCDLRVAARSSYFGVYCRRWGVPLIDGGTVRLPRLIGQGRALDLILTGRRVDADEALSMGLVSRVVPDGEALERALELASEIASHPQTCMRQDRLSALEQWSLSHEQALDNELVRGQTSLSSPELFEGLSRFGAGAGRHGKKVSS